MVRVPPLLKDGDGAYRNPGMTFEAAIRDRALAFRAAVERVRPDVVVVDRHPYGTGGELLLGLTVAKEQGGPGWCWGCATSSTSPRPSGRSSPARAGATSPASSTRSSSTARRPCATTRPSTGLPMRPTYAAGSARPPPEPGPPGRASSSAPAAAAYGDAVTALGLQALRLRTEWEGCVIAGPYAANVPTDVVHDRRISIVRNATDCLDELSRASASLQMAGYNSTAEAIACGLRPILVPRRSPRREQAIRALRLASLGLADAVDEHAHPSEVAWLLDRPRLLPLGAATAAGVRLDGAARAARHIQALGARVSINLRQRRPMQVLVP